MKTSDRLLRKIDVTGLPTWEGGNISRRLGPALELTGYDLAERLHKAITYRDRLNLCIEAMSEALDEGVSAQEIQQRRAVEDADPETHARGGGWLLIEDFSATCKPGPTGFYRHLQGIVGRIVRPNDSDRVRMQTGESWPANPSRGFHWGDYFGFADSWAEASQRTRNAEVEAREAKYRGM